MFVVMEDERLIEVVRRFPQLYDADLPEYRDPRSCANIWREIGQMLGHDERFCRRRWKNLRDTYVRARRRANRRSGDAETAVFRSPVHQHMGWLRRFIRHRDNEKNMQSRQCEQGQTEPDTSLSSRDFCRNVERVLDEIPNSETREECKETLWQTLAELYSSGIFCRESPTFHDLFGFSVDDVQDEVKRGSRLTCDICKKKGATVGCEVKRCKKSYHYPCALKGGAEVFEDQDNGRYGLYCPSHSQKKSDVVNGLTSECTKPESDNSHVEAGPSQEDNDSPSNGDPAVAGPSGLSSSSRQASKTSLKRRLRFTDKHVETSSKRQSLRNRILSDSSSDSVSPKHDEDMNMFAPVESDLDNFLTESGQQQDREDPGHPAGSTSGMSLAGSSIKTEPQEDSGDGEDMEERMSLPTPVQSSMSLSSPQEERMSLPTPVQSSVSLPSPQEDCRRVLTPVQSNSTQAPSPAPPEAAAEELDSKEGLILDKHIHEDVDPTKQSKQSPYIYNTPLILNVSSLASTPPRPDVPSGPQPNTTYSASFWKCCNAAGCTQVLFSGFIKELNDLCGRIQSDQASQEDYDLALTVMKASGKLTELVVNQQKELQKDLNDLQQAAAAMEVVVSALNTGAS